QVDVDRCPVFSLPPNNFVVQAAGVTCRGGDNGSITVTAVEPLDYTAPLEGPFDARAGFGTIASFGDLPPGDYQVCITLATAPGYSQCYALAIAEPEALEVWSNLDRSTNLLSLQLKGAENFKVRINDRTLNATAGTLDLQLDQEVNRVEVTTDRDCQGSFQQTFFLGLGASAYPNPLVDGDFLSIELGRVTTAKLQVEVYDLGGRLLKTERAKARYGKLVLDLGSLSQGLYVVKVQGPETTHEFKIVKQ